MTETATNWYAEPHATLGDRIRDTRTAAGLSPPRWPALHGVRGKTVLDGRPTGQSRSGHLRAIFKQGYSP